MNPSSTDTRTIGVLDAARADAIRTVLLARQAEHAARLATAPNHTTTMDEDGAVDDALVFDRFATDRSRRAIADIDAALARLDDGTYGSCEACRRPISLERLEAIPRTRLCITCADPSPPWSARRGPS